MRLTKKQIKDFLKNKLSSDIKWALRALEVVYNNQTEVEQVTETTREHNNIGFTAFDADILTSIYKFYKNKGYVSNKQANVIKKRIGKYWKQILDVIDINKLEKIMEVDNV